MHTIYVVTGCFPRGEVRLQAAFDRAAYMSGETAGIKASIKNDSEQNVTKMAVKLIRTISLRDDGGQRKSISDVMCRNNYSGVAAKQSEGRDLPLVLSSAHGPLLPGTKVSCVCVCVFPSLNSTITFHPHTRSHVL